MAQGKLHQGNAAVEVATLICLPHDEEGLPMESTIEVILSTEKV
jgi:hypothetical protein